MPHLRKYGVATTINIAIPKADDTAYAASADWTPASGDVKVSKDGGDVANVGTLPSAVGGTGSVLWSFVLSATEMQAAKVVVQIVDDALQDWSFEIETYGNASAEHAYDLDTAIPLVQLANGVTHGGTTARLRLGANDGTPALYISNSGGVAAYIQTTHSSSAGLAIDAEAGGISLWLGGDGSGLLATNILVTNFTVDTFLLDSDNVNDKLDAIVSKVDQIGSGQVVYSGPITQSGDIELVRGDDYLHVDGRALTFTSDSWPDLTGADVYLSFLERTINPGEPLVIEGVVVDAETVRFELTHDDTATLSSGSAGQIPSTDVPFPRARYLFDIEARLPSGTNPSIVTLVRGSAIVWRDVTPDEE